MTSYYTLYPEREKEMEMEEKLYGAAVAGDARALDQLLQEDPLILEKAALKCSDKIPLHIGAMLGHLDFVRRILDVNSEMCFARDRDGRSPLHLAAIKGKGEVLKALSLARPLAVWDRTDGGGTILHLCVKYNQLDVLKILLEIIQDMDFLNAKNDEGMTILHLAVLDQQIETIRCLANTNIDVNAKNANGKTALDIAGNKNMEIASILESSGSLRANEITTKGSEWLGRKRDTIMIVATLIATFAFQAGLNPPGGVWQGDSNPQGDHHSNKAGEAVMAYQHKKYYKNFVRVNTVAFVSSLSTILLLISGLPFMHRFFMWFLMVIMWLTVTSVALTYGISIMSITPKDYKETLSQVIEIAVSVWCCVMSLLLLGNTIRLIRKWNRGREIKKLRSRSLKLGVHDRKNGTQVSVHIR